MPTVNADAMNNHLIEISQHVAPGAMAVLVIDGAGWHRAGALKVPENIVLLKLPPYAPELNSVENIWEYLRGNKLGHQVWETYDAIVDACCNAWNSIINAPERIKSLASREWTEVKI